MTNLGLIADPVVRSERCTDQRQKILAWLASEGVSTVGILAQVCGVSPGAVRKRLVQLHALNLVETSAISLPLRSPLAVWSLTPHGAAMQINLSTTSEEFRRYEPGRVSAATIEHFFDVQKARIAFEQLGWTHWRSDRECHQLAQLHRWLKTPDAIGLDRQGNLVAIEVERTIKTTKRYEAIFSEHLQMIKAKAWSRVYYVCPQLGVAQRLSAIFTGITSVLVKGQRIELNLQHHMRIQFVFLGDIPEFANKANTPLPPNILTQKHDNN